MGPSSGKGDTVGRHCQILEPVLRPDLHSIQAASLGQNLGACGIQAVIQRKCKFFLSNPASNLIPLLNNVAKGQGLGDGWLVPHPEEKDRTL